MPPDRLLALGLSALLLSAANAAHCADERLLKHADVRAPRALVVSAAGSVSSIGFPGASGQTWRQASLAVAAGLDRRRMIEAEIDAEMRATTDIRMTARTTTRTAGGSYYVGAGVTPRATFRDAWRVVVGGEARLAERLQGSLDLRIARYRAGLTAAIEPGAAFRALPALTLSAKAIGLFDPSGRLSAGASLRADFAPESKIGGFASVARYPDREEDGVRQLSAFAAGLRSDLNAHWQLRVSAAQESRDRSYRRRTFAIALSFRPVAP